MSAVTLFLVGFFLGTLFTVIVFQVISPATVPITHLYMEDKKYECAIVWGDTVVCNVPPESAKAAISEP